MTWISTRWRPFLLFALGALIYARTLAGGFVLDDQSAIRDNPIVRQGDLAQIFSTDYWAGFHRDRSGLYRPLSVWTFALNHRLAGAGPLSFHLVNLLLHGAGAALLYLVWRRCTRQEELAWWAALFFALHPALSEAVAGLVGRADLLAALFALLALHQHLGARPARWRHLLAGAALLAALLSKESAVALPALFLLADLFQYRGFSEKCYWPAHLFYAGLTLLYLGVRHLVLGGIFIAQIDPFDNPLAGLEPPWRWVNALLVLGRYLELLVLPLRLCADYSFAALPLAPQWSLPALLLTLAVLAGLGPLVWAAWHSLPWAALGLGWLLIALAPVANLFFPIGTGMAERLLYLPAAGFALAAAALLGALGKRRALACRTVLALSLAWETWTRAGEWQDEYTLFSQAVQVQPKSARAWHILGKNVLARGEEARGLQCLQQALAIFPAYYEVHADLGAFYCGSGDYPRAQEHLARCLELRADYAPAWYNLGLTYYRLGQRDQAREAFARAIACNPEYAQAYYNLGVMDLEDKNAAQARDLFLRVLALDPEYEEARVNLEACEQLLQREGTR
ncbi:MAG: tetratricopeptide repeat protein [Candidatus Latescibacteria bacterium]|nr:tetratricopeptide repeat protein [Candidatus Latescibacterota bacterium]